MQYRPYLDGLRAVAVLAVVIFHGFPSVLPGGFVGVDVFFVLSGFLITSIIAAEIRDGSFRFADFYTRRIRRLLPAGFIVYVATCLVALVVLDPQHLKEFGRSLRAAALFFSNRYFAGRVTDYFDDPANEQPLLHTWSLAIEEQFYIIWPALLLLLLRKLTPAWRMTIVLLALTLSLGYADVTARTARLTTFFSLPARGWELLLGATLALGIGQIALGRIGATAAAVIGLLCIVGSCILLNDTMIVPGLSLLPACAGTCLVIASSFHRDTPVSRLLSHPLAVFVGLISYALYLWHWPMLALARVYLERPPGVTETAILIATAAGLSALTWRYVETPLRSGKILLISPRATIAAGVACTALIVALSLAASRNEAWLWRLDGIARAVWQQQYSPNVYFERCDGNARILADDEFCNLGVAKPAGSSFDFAIFGDSNASHWVPAYAVLAKQQGLSGRQVTQNICAPLIGVDIHVTDAQRNQCLVYQQRLVQFLERNPGLRLAILSANWLTYQGPLGQNKAAQLVSLPATGKTTLDDHVLATVRYLRSRGIKVHLIGQIPYQRIRSRCLIDALRAHEDARECAIAADAARSPITASNDLLRRVTTEVEGVTATIPVDFMCDDARCPLHRGGTILYRDYGHLSAAGAAVLAPYVLLPLSK